MTTNKKTFKVKLDEKEVELAVLKPNNKVHQNAQVIYNRAFREAVLPKDGKEGAILRAKVESVMREQKLWDDTKQAEYERLVKNLRENALKLAKGGIKLSEARKIALQMRKDRIEYRLLNMDRNSLDANTAEAQAENARFNYFVAVNTVYSTDGKPYFESYEDYLERDDADPVVVPAVTAMGQLIYNLDENFESNLPESKFLLKYKFCDEKLRLINRDGHLIDEDGRLIDEEGYFVNDKGERVDIDGRPLTDSGDFKVDFEPFIDDEGVPVEDEVLVSSK